MRNLVHRHLRTDVALRYLRGDRHVLDRGRYCVDIWLRDLSCGKLGLNRCPCAGVACMPCNFARLSGCCCMLGTTIALHHSRRQPFSDVPNMYVDPVSVNRIPFQIICSSKSKQPEARLKPYPRLTEEIDGLLVLLDPGKSNSRALPVGIAFHLGPDPMPCFWTDEVFQVLPRVARRKLFPIHQQTDIRSTHKRRTLTRPICTKYGPTSLLARTEDPDIFVGRQLERVQTQRTNRVKCGLRIRSIHEEHEVVQAYDGAPP